MNYKTECIGIMSGSSLDGLDLANCYFEYSLEQDEIQIINWEIREAKTIAFNQEWINKLKSAPQSTAVELLLMDHALGRWIGEKTKEFIAENQLSPSFIASHGHTIFHLPEAQATCQIGHGAAISTITGVDTYCDFRTADIHLGGQGTPLAPLADRFLFANYDLLINIGGIANITVNRNDNLIAYDVCPANQLLNYLSEKEGKKYDDRGLSAKSGSLNESLLKELLKNDYFSSEPPKSIDNNWVKDQFIPILEKYSSLAKDKLHTTSYFIHSLIVKEIIKQKKDFEKSKIEVLVTGGGAHNKFLQDQIKASLADENVSIHIPESDIINYKEAALMALLGLMRKHKLVNVFSSVTGANRNTISGAHYLGNKADI